MTKQLMYQYIASLVIFFVLLIVFTLTAWQVCNGIVWQPENLVYRILHTVKEYIILFISLASLMGWIGISYYFLEKPMRYLGEVVAAAEKLARPEDVPIKLPEEMKNTQDELNLIREQALRNMMIAKEAEQRKNDLILYLAHDLKTPLTSVIGYLTLLKDEPQISGNMRERYTGIALDKAQRLEDLINEFFEITRFNLTTLTLEKERINLSFMLEQIIFEFGPLLEEKNLCWKTEIAPNVEILCDPDKLQRVFDNLIRNAVNYSYAQTDIFLSMKPDGDEAEILIKNKGKTIPLEKLDRIFEQFFRLDSSRSSSNGGSGLGLAISKEIIELHGGSISAQSVDDSIAFTVRIPFGTS